MIVFCLSEVMEKKGISQNKLAKLCNWQRQYVQRIATAPPNKEGNPSLTLNTLDRLCSALECQPGDLLVHRPD